MKCTIWINCFNMPNVSVIAPVYGVEKFVGRFVESLMNQTLTDVEFIFVDDCTPDRSIDIIKEISSKFPNRVGNVKIVSHDVNKGLPTARNTGMQVATGEYIYHCDSDDYLESNALEELYKVAKAKDADYVWSDWYLTFDNNSRYMHQPSVANPREALRIVLAGGMKYNVWNKLVKRSLYEESGIKFPDSYSMGEDMTMIMLLANAKCVEHVSQPLYHYIRTNSEAMTQVYSEKHLEQLKYNTNRAIEYLLKNVSDGSIDNEIEWFKLNVKLPFLFSGSDEDFRLWKEWFREANPQIMSNPVLPFRTRLLQKFAAMNLTFINKFYCQFVQRFIYGKIYK